MSASSFYVRRGIQDPVTFGNKIEKYRRFVTNVKKQTIDKKISICYD